MKTTFNISGMTCEACVYKVKYILSNMAGVKSVEVALPNFAEIESDEKIALKTFQEAFKPHGKYKISVGEDTDRGDTSPWSASSPTTSGETAPRSVSSPTEMPTETTWLKTYKPILLIFGFITTVSAITAFDGGHLHLMHFMNSFMAGFFLVFSFFKLLNVKDFANSYVMYDLLAARWKPWGLLYPFVELGLGLAYLTHFQPFATNIVTLIVMGFSSFGVIQSVINKQKIRCACLGAVFNLPMSTVTIIEDLLMVAMAGVMLIFNF